MKFITKKNLSKSTYLLLAVAACAVVSSGKEEASASVGKKIFASSATGANGSTGNLSRTSGGAGTPKLNRSLSDGNIFTGNPGIRRDSLSSTVSLPNIKIGSNDGLGATSGPLSDHKYGFKAADFKSFEGIKPEKKYVQYVNGKGELKTLEKTPLNRFKLLFKKDTLGIEKVVDSETGRKTKYIYRTSPRWIKGEDILGLDKSTQGTQDGGTGTGPVNTPVVPPSSPTQGTQGGTGTGTGNVPVAPTQGTQDGGTGTGTKPIPLPLPPAQGTQDGDKGPAKPPKKVRSSLHLDIVKTGDMVEIKKRDSGDSSKPAGQTKTTGDSKKTGPSDDIGILTIRNVTDEQIKEKFGNQGSFLDPVLPPDSTGGVGGTKSKSSLKSDIISKSDISPSSSFDGELKERLAPIRRRLDGDNKRSNIGGGSTSPKAEQVSSKPTVGDGVTITRTGASHDDKTTGKVTDPTVGMSKEEKIIHYRKLEEQMMKEMEEQGKSGFGGARRKDNAPPVRPILPRFGETLGDEPSDYDFSSGGIMQVSGQRSPERPGTPYPSSDIDDLNGDTGKLPVKTQRLAGDTAVEETVSMYSDGSDFIGGPYDPDIQSLSYEEALGKVFPITRL